MEKDIGQLLLTFSEISIDRTLVGIVTLHRTSVGIVTPQRRCVQVLAMASTDDTRLLEGLSNFSKEELRDIMKALGEFTEKHPGLQPHIRRWQNLLWVDAHRNN